MNDLLHFAGRLAVAVSDLAHKDIVLDPRSKDAEEWICPHCREKWEINDPSTPKIKHPEHCPLRQAQELLREWSRACGLPAEYEE